MKATSMKILGFLALLLVSNLFLLKSGLWMHQDASYWYRTPVESLHALYAQLLTFSNFDYYSGFDSGMLSYSKIITASYSFVLFKYFGSSLSQILFILSGYIFSFISFYLFSGIFEKERGRRYLLSLLYAFNPLSFSLQGFSIIMAGIPLFIFSFHAYLTNKEKIAKFLFLNILSLFIVIVYIRFVEIALIVILAFCLYLFRKEWHLLFRKRVPILLITYVLMFMPSIFSFISQRIENSDTVFYYGALFKESAASVSMANAFNLMQSFDLVLYDNIPYALCGIFMFVLLLLLLVKQNSAKKTSLQLFLISLSLLGISLYGLYNITGSHIYPVILKLFPFITNAPVWALYISLIPLLLLSNLLIVRRKIYTFVVFIYLAIAISPLLNLQDMKLQKFDMSQLPTAYKSSFLVNSFGFPEATSYIPGICWRAEYMNGRNIPTQCINSGIFYRPISYDNPRFISGEEFNLSKKLLSATNLGNLRITHNLKNVILAKDIVVKKGPGGPLTGEKDIQRITEIKKIIARDNNLNRQENVNFSHYSFLEKDNYDFFLYAPLKLVRGQDIFGESVNIHERPVFTDEKMSIGQSPEVEYKASPLNGTKIFLKVKLADTSPFVLQLNQSFNRNWHLRWITKGEFEKEKCINENSYSITNNKRCQISIPPMSIGDGTYLLRQSLSENAHFKSNLLNNMWYIMPDKYADSVYDNDYLYAVITYDKQIYFSWMIVISLITGAVVVILVGVQEFDSLKEKFKQ